MRFALLGNHPDGLSMTHALTATGRHSLVAYCGPVPTFEQLRQSGLSPKGTGDLEEVLADPTVEAVIVAGTPGERGPQLRRALQSERHVLCVHPADPSPDIAYEAAMIQTDTRHVLLPLLGDALHPAVAELSQMIRNSQGPLGPVHLITVEHTSTDESLLDAGGVDPKPGLPGWDVLRALAGEIVEVSAFAVGEEMLPGQPLLVAARTEAGTLIQSTFLARQSEAGHRFTVHGDRGRGVLTLPGSWPGPVSLSWQMGAAKEHREWPDWSPWPVLVEVFEAATGSPLPLGGEGLGVKGEALQSAHPSPPAPLPQGERGEIMAAPLPQGERGEIMAAPRPLGERGDTRPPVAVRWQSEVRCLELDDAARRSVHRRRANTLDFQEVSEEVGFKGTMTLVGCGLLWSVLLLTILAAWDKRFLFVVFPLLAIFLGLQLLRWVIPASPSHPQDRDTSTGG